MAVSKRHDAAAIKAAQAAGLRAFGENYLQEALTKIPQIAPPVEWHFIGRVQSNKTAAIASHFDWVQTVASAKIARRLSEQRPADKPPLNLCVQVTTDGGDHGGIEPAATADLCDYIATLPRLRLRGLMTIPQPTATEQEQRLPFRLLRELRDELCDRGHELDTLSMGMSADLEAAVAEGSTMVRIGTALFGPRPV